MLRLIGIDPGYAIVGWAIVDFTHGQEVTLVDCGVISTSKENEIGVRLLEIFNDINSLLAEYKPEHAGIETLMFQNNAKTAMAVSEARGVITLALEQAFIPVKQITPLQVKNSITGYGKADKKQVQENVKKLCGLEDVPKPDDAADAVAVAICTHDFIKSGL